MIDSKGCSRLFIGLSASSLPSFRALETTMSPVSTSSAGSKGPFSGLVICVTGLSKGIVFWSI